MSQLIGEISQPRAIVYLIVKGRAKGVVSPDGDSGWAVAVLEGCFFFSQLIFFLPERQRHCREQLKVGRHNRGFERAIEPCAGWPATMPVWKPKNPERCRTVGENASRKMVFFHRLIVILNSFFGFFYSLYGCVNYKLAAIY